ncbi:MAG: hypothetical protein M1269_12065 [Chloroflexi bacterium]|nr:hypothetical protein [Chloroflexota bacterium]
MKEDGNKFQHSNNSGDKNYFLWFFYLAVFILILFIAYPYLTKDKHYGFIDYANLIIHESGHYVFFAFFGEFLRVLGGTIMQLAVPLAFTAYFLLFRKDIFPGLVTCFWFFENMLNISIYMKDAKFMILPLFGNEYAHDWNFLFGRMKLLHESVEIGDFFKGMAVMGMVISLLALTVYLAWKNPFWNLKKLLFKS